MTDNEAVRLELLRMASGAGEDIATTVARAEAYHSFIVGTQTPREQINAALDAANVR